MECIVTELNDTQKANRAKIVEFTEQLRRLKFPASPISIELADYVASAFESYLDGKTKTLEAAFGLNAGKGTKGYSREFNRKRAERIISLHEAGKTWEQVCNELGGKDGIPKDEREIRRLCDEFLVEVLAERITLEDLLGDEEGG
jgi:hypothetical protein